MSSLKRDTEKRDSDAADDGKNPYIPKFIANSPWYAQNESQSSDYLDHQRSHKTEVKTDWYKRGKNKKAAASTKFRPGACTNCGAMTHKAQDCLERPRKVGAKYSGVDLQPDDDIREITTTWDSKRDRWNGFDADDYKEIMRTMEARQAKEAGAKEAQGASEQTTENDEDSLPVWSLRERHDQADYVKSFREPENGNLNESHAEKLRNKAVEFDGLRESVDKAVEKGVQLNLEANPTEAYLKLKKLKEEEELSSQEAKRKLLEKYGAQQQHLPPKPKELPVQVESTDFAAANTSLKGVSRYPEDVYPGNHTSVWGSYWKDGKWGYKCCHSVIQASYCVGETGIMLEKDQAGNTGEKHSLDLDTSRAQEVSAKKSRKI